jgi:NADPH:quinone reductase
MATKPIEQPNVRPMSISLLPDDMRAWAIDSYGGPDVMHVATLPTPKPAPSLGEVLIRMHTAEVGDWDAMVRSGEWPMERPFPLVLGLAGSGVVAATGDKVERFREGDEVYAYTYPMYDNGAWAEYMLVPEEYVAPAPREVDLATAGAVPIVGLTAHETIVDILKVKQDEVVLITGASGGVGHLAVQIARRQGAHVLATASVRNREFVKSLGAEVVIDYMTEDIVATVKSHHPRGAHKALNCVGGKTANIAVKSLREGGKIVDLTGSVTVKRKGIRVTDDYIVRGDGKRLGVITQLIDHRKLHIQVEKIYRFEHAPDALDRVLTKHVCGKIALRID